MPPSEEINARMRATVAAGQSGWDELWQKGVTPWDAGKSQISLLEMLDAGKIVLPERGKVLVPGCGKGYDCMTLARYGRGHREALGLEIAQTAVNGARELLSKEDSTTQSLVSFELVDFFDETVPGAPFDVIYDHTFFCAIPLAKRPQWAQRMIELCRPGGILILQMFPLKKDSNPDEGPPFLVAPGHYHDLLKDSFEKILLETPVNSSDARRGREMIGVYRRR